MRNNSNELLLAYISLLEIQDITTMWAVMEQVEAMMSQTVQNQLMQALQQPMPQQNQTERHEK